jgi:hypothetical protein
LTDVSRKATVDPQDRAHLENPDYVLLDVLADLTDSDLRDHGVSLGDRTRLLKAALALRGGSMVPVRSTWRARPRSPPLD